VKYFIYSRHIIVKEVVVDLDKYILTWLTRFTWWLVLD